LRAMMSWTIRAGSERARCKRRSTRCGASCITWAVKCPSALNPGPGDQISDRWTPLELPDVDEENLLTGYACRRRVASVVACAVVKHEPFRRTAASVNNTRPTKNTYAKLLYLPEQRIIQNVSPPKRKLTPAR
jgi:hypothetical protein